MLHQDPARRRRTAASCSARSCATSAPRRRRRHRWPRTTSACVFVRRPCNMAEITSASPTPLAVARSRRRRGGDRGLHPPDPVRRRSRAAAPGPPRPRADPHDPRHPLRPDDRHGRGAQARVLLRRQPRRRLPAPLPRRGRARLAAADRARGAQPRRDGQPLRRRRGAAAVRDHARLRRHRPGRSRTRSRRSSCPFTGEQLVAVPALRPDVAIIHAQEADREGNVQLWGIPACRRRPCSRPTVRWSRSSGSSTSSSPAPAGW